MLQKPNNLKGRVNVIKEKIMLVLTRSQLQEIVIGENGEIRVTILSIDENQVKLGFTASKDIPIYRLEIFRKAEQKQENLLEEYA